MNIYEKLSNIQNELKCNKNQFNKFGGYKYRSCEDILEAVKPICQKYETVLVLTDELVVLGEGVNQYETIKDDAQETETNTTIRGQRFYIKATATLYDIEERIIDDEIKTESISNTAYAREEESKKGMDGSQITGTASSYARKYALNGLFNIDDTKDADTDEFTKQTQEGGKEKQISKTQGDALLEQWCGNQTTKTSTASSYTSKDDGEKKISKTQADALFELAKNRGIEKDDMIATLLDKGYKSFYEIKVKDLTSLKTYFETHGRD